MLEHIRCSSREAYIKFMKNATKLQFWQQRRIDHINSKVQDSLNIFVGTLVWRVVETNMLHFFYLKQEKQNFTTLHSLF